MELTGNISVRGYRDIILYHFEDSSIYEDEVAQVNFAWELTIAGKKIVAELRKVSDKTGLMTYIVPTIKSVVRDYLTEQQPRSLSIIGKETRTIKLYQSFSDITPDGYKSASVQYTDICSGIKFMKEKGGN